MFNMSSSVPRSLPKEESYLCIGITGVSLRYICAALVDAVHSVNEPVTVLNTQSIKSGIFDVFILIVVNLEPSIFSVDVNV